VWAIAGQAMLAFHVQPIAVAIVWLIGFVWGTGYIITGRSGADRLATVWIGTMAATAAAAFLISLAVS
jgi:hypothetical protein